MSVDFLTHCLEPIILYVRDLAKTSVEDHGESIRALEACRMRLTIERAPRVRMLDFGAWIAQHDRTFDHVPHEFQLEPLPDVQVDPDQCIACIAIVASSASLVQDAVLVFETFVEEGVPRVAVSLDGPGSFSEPLGVDPYFATPLAIVDQRWTHATRGGRIDRTENGFVFRLAGRRELPEVAYYDTAELDKCLDRAENAVRKGDCEVAVAALENALALLEAARRAPEPTDLAGLPRGAREIFGAAFEHRGIALELHCEPHLFPILVSRSQMQLLLITVLRFIYHALPHGGAGFVLITYDASNLAAAMTVTVAGDECPTTETFHYATFRHVVLAHEGQFEYRLSRREIVLEFVIPDTIARKIEQTIPNHLSLDAKSRQVLRLLETVPGLPSRDALLEGVLEHELERWLLPRLTQPLAVNAAFEAARAKQASHGGSTELLNKVLAQIQKGKPRKDVAQPRAAAEIVLAFDEEQRHRAALGIDKLSNMERHDLARYLGAAPVDAMNALRLIASVHVRNKPN